MRPNANANRAGLVQRLTLAPYSFWAALFVVVPLFFVAYYAFTDAQFNFTLDNISRFFTATSAVDGGRRCTPISSSSCALQTGGDIHRDMPHHGLSHGLYHFRAPRAQKIMITLIMIPMWMNFLIRTYAWMTILQDTGILNGFLSMLGLGRVHIIGTEAAVVIGMVYDYFPYMILPIYSVMAKMDVRLIEAARDLGCNSAGVLRRVIWPLSLPGVISGVNMVLIPSISTFYISEARQRQVLSHRRRDRGQYVANNLHFAAAIAFVLMIILLACMALLQHAAGKRAAVKGRHG